MKKFISFGNFEKKYFLYIIAYFAIDQNNGSAQAQALTTPPASTPMLIKGNANTIYHFATTSSSPTDVTGNAFHAGSNADVTSNPAGGEYKYILKGDAFYQADANYVASNKAYLQLSKNAAARVLIFADEASAIRTVANDNNDTESYYNLQGVKVAVPTKGLYIHNGKKLFVK